VRRVSPFGIDACSFLYGRRQSYGGAASSSSWAANRMDRGACVAHDVPMTTAVPSHPLARPARATPVAANGLELVVAATLGAASLSLRIVLDALAGATRRSNAPTDLVAQLAFAGLASGLLVGRSFARAVGAGLDAGARAGVTALELTPPVLRTPIEDALQAWRERDRARGRELAEAELIAEDLVTSLVPRIVSATLDQLDLTSIVRRRVDLDAIVRDVDLDAVAAGIDLDAVAARLDVNAVASRLDLDAVIGRLDLAEIAQTVIDEIDLPEVIRRSTGSVASETVRGVRMQSIEADRSIEGLVDRILRRRGPRRLDAAGVSEAEDTIAPGGDGP
jgi:hypothetical protein